MSNNFSQDAGRAAATLLDALSTVHRALSDAALPAVAQRLAAYAWSGDAYESPASLEEAQAELASAEELCRANFTLPTGEDLLSAEDKATLTQLSNAVVARMNLDNGDSVRVAELAALARVAEKTIRMATNASRPGSIRVRKEGHRAQIDAPEALAWLSRRSDFYPTRVRGELADQPMISSAEDVTHACKQWRQRKDLTVNALAEAMGWNAQQLKAYDKLETGKITDQMTRFQPQALLALAKHLGMPDPKTFAVQAYRVLALKHADYLTDRQLADGAD